MPPSMLQDWQKRRAQPEPAASQGGAEPTRGVPTARRNNGTLTRSRGGGLQTPTRLAQVLTMISAICTVRRDGGSQGAPALLGARSMDKAGT